MKPLAILFAGLALAASAAAQNDAPRSAEKPADKARPPFVFEPGVVELRTLIERCGAYLQRNILVDDSELLPNANRRPKAAPAAAGGAPAAPAEGPTGPFVELQLPVVTDRDGCEEMLTSLLWTRGLALVPLDEKKAVYEVLAMTGARAREITMRAVTRTPAQVLARPSLRLFVTVVVQLKNVNATIATNALRPYFASSGGNQGSSSLMLGNVGTATAIVLTGPQDQVAAALSLLESADVPQPPDARPEITQRLDALSQQNAQLAQRIAALEEKLKQKS